MTTGDESASSQFREVLGQAEVRWARLEADQPDLGPAIALQRRLVARGLELTATIDRTPAVTTTLPPSDVAGRLRTRRPAFTGASFEVDTTQIGPLVMGFCDDLATGGAGPPAERVRRTLEERQIDLGSLLAASLMRQLHAVRTTANHIGIAPDLLWLVAELGAAPLANRLQDRYLVAAAGSHVEVRDALATWDEGACPACGSWPAFAERLHEQRHLRCSFCGTSWQPTGYRCIYCDEDSDRFLTAAADDPSGARLELCRRCGGYLKSLPVSDSTPFGLLAVADLSSSDLDVKAVERGYGRPPMREIDAV